MKMGTGATTTHRPTATPESGPSLPRAGENAAVWTLWFTYGAFYFCRQNLAPAVPGLKAAISDGGLALSGEQVGWILASLKFAYGLGQFVNGQLSERFPPRAMLAIGMFGSAALNVLFGFSTGFYFLLFVWAMNGVCQSLGWTPCVRVAANWVPIERRGRAMGIIGTGYQITLGLTYIIAGQSAEYLGWRAALYVPAVLLVLAGIFMLVFLRERPPNDVAQPSQALRNGSASSRTGQPQLSFTECLYWTLYNPTLWLLGITLALLNACRYGYFDWGLTHLMETREMPVGKAVLQYCFIALGGALGAYLAGWATDRFFGSRRGPVICILLIALAALSLVYESAVQFSAIETIVLLVMIGFCIIGPQVLLVGTAPADLAHRGTSAAAAGFVNFMGYLGAAAGDVVTGYFSAPEHGGWQTAIYIWSGWAFAGAAITAILWNTKSEKVGMLSAAVPKFGALIALVAAVFAVATSGLPISVRYVTYAAIVLTFATFVNRFAAWPVIVLTVFSILMIFNSYIQSPHSATLYEIFALVSYGIVMLAALMILIERKGEQCALS